MFVVSSPYPLPRPIRIVLIPPEQVMRQQWQRQPLLIRRPNSSDDPLQHLVRRHHLPSGDHLDRAADREDRRHSRAAFVSCGRDRGPECPA